MVLPITFSRRKRQASSTIDVYHYDSCSRKLRQQIVIMIRDVNKTLTNTWGIDDLYPDIVSLMRKELGVERLEPSFVFHEEFDNWFKKEQNVDYLLDAIGFAAGIMRYHLAQKGWEEIADHFVEELNARMLEDCFGYQYEGNQIIQINSQYVHSDVILPAFGLLSDDQYRTANDEFRQAHKEFRDGNYDDSIHDCCNAFESVLKVILTAKGWAFSPNDTASRLLAVAFANDLIPSYMQNEFNGLRTILESGVPTVRNKDGGHGAGVNPRNIPRHIAAFQLHQTAAAIVLLVEAAK